MPTRRLSLVVLLVSILSVAGLTSNASASLVLQLSTHSSESSTIPASQLSAELEFSVTGNQLTLSVTNLTSSPALNISRVYFNVDSTITGLSLTNSTISGWNLIENLDQQMGFNTMADGFGIYSYRLSREPMQPTILAGDTETFTFNISGSGFSAGSFKNTLSADPDGTHLRGLAAAMFIEGPDDASAFGALIPLPAPGAVALLIAAFLVGVRRRRD